MIESEKYGERVRGEEVVDRGECHGGWGDGGRLVGG